MTSYPLLHVWEAITTTHVAALCAVHIRSPEKPDISGTAEGILQMHAHLSLEAMKALRL